jgi:tetratricopeptide (TPR) repeat protein
LTGEQKRLLAKRHTDSTEAYHLHLQGRYNWNKRTPSGTAKAVEYFEQAIRLDPHYALAYAGLADSYNLMAGNSGLPPRETFPKAKAAALKALEMDNTLAEAHTSLSLVRYLFDWEWSAAEQGFQRAIELNPNYATAHHWYGEYLVLSRRFDEGYLELIQARELDPLSLPINADIGQYYFFTRQYERAIEQLNRLLDLEPNFVRALALLGWTFEQMGRFEEAIAKFEQATALSGSRTLIVAGLGHAHAVSGNRAEAVKILEALKEQASRLYVSPYEIAVIHAALDENERAFDCLEQACDDHSVWLSWLEVDPRLDTLRADVRFQDLLARVRND